MRTYYDHELGYRRIAERGGAGWDDLPSLADNNDSYVAIDAFLASPHAPARADAIDLGCGGGQVAVRLASRGYRVTGIDFAPTAIELARCNAPQLVFVEGDCLALPFPAASFDLAIDCHVLHCLLGDDRARFVGEAARVLRPGGLLFTDTMSREGDLDPARAPVDPTTFISTTHNRYWTAEAELDALLVAAGFEIALRERRPSDPGFGDMLVRVCRLSGGGRSG